MNDESLSLWRDFAARVFIPSALLFGAASNLVNFVILSRPDIRACSTRIYLTVLTFTDTSLLMSIFLISKQFRDNAHSHEHEVYWKTFGLTRWFHTAFVYISVYLTLFLTMDRYYCSFQQQRIAAETSTTCRISKARNTASMVVFVCLLITISSAFEYKLEAKDLPAIKSTTNVPTANEHHKNWNFHGSTTILPSHSLIRYDETSNDDVNVANLRSNKTSGSVVANNNNDSSNVANGKNHSGNASIGPSFHLFPVKSDLARSKFYRVIFKPIASLLQLIPFIMMGFFMWKLAVDARGRRGLMVQNVSYSLPQRQHQQQHRPDMLIRDEQQQQQLSRLVIVLVVIFLICHTPNAVYSLCQATKNFLSTTFANGNDDDADSTARSDDDDRKIGKNFGTGFEILCLVLMCISCCSKLLLYLLAYDEFLASIKSFTTCFHVASVDDEQPKNNISSKVEEFTRRKSLPLPQIFLTHSQSESKLVTAANMSTPFRHSHRHRLTSISIPVADFTEPLSNSSHPPARRMSMMPSVSYGVFNPPIRLQTTNEMRQARVNRQASTRSQRVAATLANPSSSSTSNLLRSRSLAALHPHSHMRHSPNCKLRR